MSDSFDLFTSLLGGKQNLPPKLSTAPPYAGLTGTAPSTAATPDVEEDAHMPAPQVPKGRPTDLFGNLQTVEDFMAENAAQASNSNRYKAKPKTAPTTNQNHLDARQSRPAGTENAANGAELDDRMDEESPVGIGFCPFLAINKFPYKFVPAKYLQPIASAHFDRNQIYEREWDFFYAWNRDKAIVFVPEIQVQSLLNNINANFPIDWQFSARSEEEGLLIRFTDPNPDLRPRFLGHANTRDQYEILVDNIPAPIDFDAKFPSNDPSLAAFNDHMAKASAISRAKGKGKRSVKISDPALKQLETSKQILRAQRYLGLAPTQNPSTTLPDLSTLTLTTFTPASPPPFTRNRDAIFISIDVEAYERSHSTITEVGVATLDTRDLATVPPGKNGEDWHPLIRARHFRVKEHASYINREFVHGCPDKFEFGKQSLAGGSEFVPLADMPRVLTSCFHAPFSGSATSAPNPEDEGEEEKRTLILLGHDPSADIAYCHTLGFSPLNRGNLVEVLDTATMYRQLTQDVNPRSLGTVLHGFDFSAWNLHNAGNDAVYTVWALLGICVQDAVDKGKEGEEVKGEGKDVEAKHGEEVHCDHHDDTDGGGLSTPGGAVLDV